MENIKTLSRDEMKQIMAGYDRQPCIEGPVSNKEFCQEVGCHASNSSGDTCQGSDGCNYSWATSC